MSDGRFEGFSQGTLEFYRGIAANNDKAWFEAHREDYATHVVAPAQRFIETVGAELNAVRPELGYSPNHTGRGSFKKIHTDQRFQKGRPPFKTYAQMFFWEGPLKTKKANSAFYLHLEPSKIVLGGGMAYFDGPMLRAFREAVDHRRSGPELARVVEGALAQGFSFGEPHYKNVPRGFAKDHKRAGLLRHNALFAHREEPVPETFFGPGFVDHCLDTYRALLPLHDWCVRLLRKSV